MVRGSATLLGPVCRRRDGQAYGFAVLQVSGAIELEYPSRKEALDARGAIAACGGHAGVVNSVHVFELIKQMLAASKGEGHAIVSDPEDDL